MPAEDKRKIRQLKRDLKRAGNKKRRQHLKRDLVRDPESAHDSPERLGRFRSAEYNGLDRDATRGQEAATDEEE